MFSSEQPFENYIAAFVKQIDEGTDPADIERDHAEASEPRIRPYGAPSLKCSVATPEGCSAFSLFSKEQKCQPINSSSCACGCMETACPKTDPSVEMAAEGPLPDEDQAQGSFTVSGSTDAKSFYAYDEGDYYHSKPYYRHVLEFPNLRHGKGNRVTISPLGGGDVVHLARAGLHHAHAASSSRTDPYAEHVAIMDSGCNRHFFRNSHRIINRRKANFRVATASGQITDIHTKGDILLQVHDEHGNELEPLILSDASVSHGSPLNLISVSMLCEAGSKVVFEKGNSYFTFKGRNYPLIEQDGLYILKLDEVLSPEVLIDIRRMASEQGHIPEPDADGFALAADWSLWHERFGHTSRKRLKFLFDNGALEGLHVKGSHAHNASCKCSTCLMNHNAKLHIGDVRQFDDAIFRKGQLVLCDVCGPFPKSVDGYTYVLSFVDQYSKFSACYFLRKKSDSEAALEAYVRFCEREGVIIKEIRSDCGGEFGGAGNSASDSGEGGLLRPEELEFFFKRVCSKHKIIHVPTPPRRPELHGVIERHHLTTTKMANAMLFSARLSFILWPAAFSHANMLKNRLSVRGLGPYTPYELWYGRRPRVDRLRTFGCDCYKLLSRYPKIPGQMARKRLIYVGETGDRMGWRVFCPTTYTFSTEFELIFDENSAQSRINHLKLYDARRDLAKKGKLLDLPLQSDDFAPTEANISTNDAVRRVFSSSQPSPAPMPLESRGRVVNEDEVQSRDGGLSQQTPAGSGPVISGESSEPDVSHSLLPETSTRTVANPRGSIITKHSEPNRIRPHSVSFQPVESSNSPIPSHDSVPSMGNGAESAEQRERECTREHTAPTPTDGEDEVAAERSGTPTRRSLRQGHATAHGGSNYGTIGNISPQDGHADLDEYVDVDEVDLIDDGDAMVYGPLTQHNLDAERKRCKFDPRHPLRPLRILPVGRAEPDSPDLRQFRQHAMKHNIPIKFSSNNPKLKGSASWKRYERYKLASNFTEFLELSTTARSASAKAEQRAIAMKDFSNDALRGYITFPSHEHNSSAHFVDAAELARLHGTTNIHALYSARELKSARLAAIKEESAIIAASIEEHARAAAIREAKSTPLTFHDHIKALWEYDATLQLNEHDLMKESAFGAAQVHDLDMSGLPEPSNFREASSPDHPEREKWKESMAKEIKTLEDRGTWELVPRASIGKHRPVKCKFVYRKKLLRDNSVQHKSRLVGCGYSQIQGVDFNANEVRASVATYSSMRFLMSLACQRGYSLSQADIQGAYLESYLTQAVYMEPPPSLRGPNGEPPRDEQGRELVCKLKRGIYGLRQSGYLWGQCLKEFLTEDPNYNMDFKELTGEENLYVKNFEINGRMEQVIVGVYVDDLLIAASSEAARLHFMEKLNARFPVNPNATGLITFDKPGLVLSMRVRYDQSRGILELDQLPSIEALARKFDVTGLAKKSMPITASVLLPKLEKAEVDINTYLSVLGSCLHIAQVSRPDIAYAVSVLCRHSSTPGTIHMQAAINLVNYLYNSRDLFIRYSKGDFGNVPELYEKGSKVDEAKSIEERLVASTPEPAANSPALFIDADFAGDVAYTRRSTSGMICMMNGGPISWSSRLQKLCALSTAESEITAVTDAAKEAVHIKLMCEEVGVRPIGVPLTVWEDNDACLRMGSSMKSSKNARHFATRLRFLNELVHDGTIQFSRVATADQLADGMTKALNGTAFFKFRKQVLHSPHY